MVNEPLNAVSWAPYNPKTPSYIILGCAGCDGNLYLWKNNLD